MSNKTLYILTYDHGGYVLWCDKLKDRFASALDWLDKYPSFKTGLDFEAFTFDELERIDPEFLQVIKDALKKYEGRLGLGSTTYGQPLSLFISEESNVRQLTYAIKSNLRNFGTTPSVYAISEFALNNQCPQLLKLSGYKAALMRTHVMNYGYQRTFDCPWGLWVGRDGTELPAVPATSEQGMGYFNCTIDNWVLTRWPGEAEQSLEDFEKTMEKYSPLLASRYDDLTLRKEELVVHAEEKGNCRFILLDEIPGIYGEATEKMPTTDNDFHGRMPWGYCGNETFNGIRTAENNAAVAEKLNAVAVMLGGESSQADLQKAWENVLITQHHDVTICGLLDESRRFLPESLAASQKVTDSSLAAIAPHFASGEKGVLAFNPTSHASTGWVETEAGSFRSASLNGKALPTELSDGKLRILVTLPGLTAARIDLSAEESVLDATPFSFDAASGKLESPLYTVVLNRNGIVSIFNKETGLTVADNGEGQLFRAVINDEDCVSLGGWSVSVSEHSATAVSTGEIGTVPFRFEMKLSADRPTIDCKASFDIKDQLIGKIGITKGLDEAVTVNNFVHETKLRFCLDLCLENDRRMVRDMPFSISDWDGSVEKVIGSWYKENHVLADCPVSPEESWNSVTYLQGIYWVALRDKLSGLAVINKGCMGSAVQGNSISIPLIYSNDYIWNARYLTGTFENSFSLLPLGEISDADIHRIAFSVQQPIIAADVLPGKGELTELSVAEFSAQGGQVMLTALYPEDGNLYARFCNYSDNAATANVSVGRGSITAETDLLGRDLASSDGQGVAFRPWEIKTFRISL